MGIFWLSTNCELCAALDRSSKVPLRDLDAPLRADPLGSR